MIPFPSAEESNLIENYIILPFVLDVLERDKKIFRTSPFKFPRLYYVWVEQIMDKVTKDLFEVRKGLRNNRIFVYHVVRTEKEIKIKYKYRGYHFDLNYLWGTVRSMVMTKMKGYLMQK